MDTFEMINFLEKKGFELLTQQYLQSSVQKYLLSYVRNDVIDLIIGYFLGVRQIYEYLDVIDDYVVCDHLKNKSEYVRYFGTINDGVILVSFDNLSISVYKNINIKFDLVNDIALFNNYNIYDILFNYDNRLFNHKYYIYCKKNIIMCYNLLTSLILDCEGLKYRGLFHGQVDIMTNYVNKNRMVYNLYLKNTIHDEIKSNDMSLLAKNGYDIFLIYHK